MDVLLIEDVDSLGLAGEVVTVANGYGRNYLIPHNLATAATKSALKQADQIRKAGERKRARQVTAAQHLAQRIEGITLKFQARSGETGKLYGSVTTADMATSLEQELGQEIDRRKIMCDSLRQLGDHAVEVRLLSNVSAQITVIIEPIEPEIADEEAPSERESESD